MKDYQSFHKVLIHETFTKGDDREVFLAFMFLKEKYPSLTYQSYDGYTCTALVDYDKKLLWDRDLITNTDSGEVVIKVEKDIWKCSMTEIVDRWVGLVEEREK